MSSTYSSRDPTELPVKQSGVSPSPPASQPCLLGLDETLTAPTVQPFKTQLLKWIGNKQRFAHEIASYFPDEYGTYHEPFLGSGGVLATVAPANAYASDAFAPLIEIFQTLHDDTELLCKWYEERWQQAQDGDKVEAYEAIKADFNRSPNGADLVFLSRACYGGVVRFRQRDGYMSTPCGPHDPIAPKSFRRRAQLWAERTAGTTFSHMDFREAFERAAPGDVIYCDPPYVDTQKILYGAQSFQLSDLLECIQQAKARGVFVVLSIDGTKKSGSHICDIPIPDGLFEREILVNVGRSMLKRFQSKGKTLEAHEVRDRLLVTY